MKKLFPLFTGLLLIACNSNDKKTANAPMNTDLIQQNLLGKVQHYEETTYNVDSAGKQKMDSSIGVNDFDEKGYELKYSTKDPSGKITSEQTISHYDNGAAKEIVTTKNGKVTYKMDAEADSNGKYTSAKTYDSTGKQDGYYTDLKTTDYGIVNSGKNHFMNGKIKGTFDMTYDKAIFTGGSSTDSLGRTDYKGTAKADDKGNLIEENYTELEKDSSKTIHVTYKYDSFDDKGNWTQRTTYDEKGKPTKIVKRTYTYYKD